jgi:anti-sigma factor RsiW
MTTIEHSVAPEDVMALMDGELAGAEAQAVQAHVKECAECAALAEELRQTARALSRWSVPAVPTGVEDSVTAAVAKSAVDGKSSGRRGAFSGGFRGWKLAVSGGAVAVVLLAMVVLWPTATQFRRPVPMPMHIGPTTPPMYDSLQSPRFEDRKVGAPRLNSMMQAVNAPGVAQQAESLAAKAESVSGGFSGAMSAPLPMIARGASLTIVVKDVEAARTSLDAILAEHHGYFAQLNVSAPDGGPRSLLSSLRIPAGELQPAVAAIRKLGRVDRESQSGEEVSQRHADLVARLKTARETEERFQAILQQRTGKVSDVLEVEQNIARVRGEIEGMEAEQRALEHRVDFATVEVQLNEEYKARFESPTASVSTQMRNALVAGYHHVTDTLLDLVLFVEEFGPPLLLWLVILGLPIVLAWRRYKRIRTGV